MTYRKISDLYCDAVKSLLSPEPAVLIPRFPKLNKITGGLRPFEFSILCGATGTGKTTLAANLSSEFIKSKDPHFVASVETGSLDYMRRLFSIYAGRDWNTGDPIPLSDVKDFTRKNASIFKDAPKWISLFEERVKSQVLISEIKHQIDKNGIKVAIIDNLNFFLEVTKADSQIVEMDRVIHDLIIFCKQYPIHIVMIMHPKKTDHGRVESEFDIKGSSTAVQEAHNVFLFNRAHPDLIKNKSAQEGDREIKIAKMR